MQVTHFSSPLGVLELRADHAALISARFVEDVPTVQAENDEILSLCLDHLNEYFFGSRTEFNLPLCPAGTDFQQRVWQELQKIPFGKTIRYMDLAKRLGDPKVIRAAGTANGKNPIAIIIPCHRVIGSNGSLTGYSGGLKRKQWLLEHESAQPSLF